MKKNNPLSEVEETSNYRTASLRVRFFYVIPDPDRESILPPPLAREVALCRRVLI